MLWTSPSEVAADDHLQGVQEAEDFVAGRRLAISKLTMAP